MSRDPFDDLVFRQTPGAPTVEVSKHKKEAQDKKISPSPRSHSFTGRNSAFAPPSSGKRPSPRQQYPIHLDVNLYIHEEVAATQDKNASLDDISSYVLIDGTIEAKLSSQYKKNPPISIRISDPDYLEDTNVHFNETYMTVYGPAEFNTLTVPKPIKDNFQLATYSRSVTKKFMPLLVQSRVVRTGSHLEKCQVAVQIRTNLNNVGSLREITLVMAVPPTVVGKTIFIISGDGSTGTYDELKRVIRWSVKELKQGSSISFGVESMVTSTCLVDEMPKFPIMLRCTSVEDTVSSMQVECKELDGNHPVALNVVRKRSFRLLHRLPS